MRAIKFAAALVIGLASLAGCQREDLDEPLKLSGKVFIFNYRVAQATYVVTLTRNGPLPEPSFAEASFENPAGGEPLVTRTRIFPFWEKVSLESPPVHCVVKDRPYAISVRVVDGRGKVLQIIETALTSSLDQSILPGKPLVVGPVYTPNPDVYGVDGTVDYAQETSCPDVAAR
ncbi:MAG: hypothetical protein ACK4UW_17230 [Rhizobium rhizophilum]|uniref:hypothetical protein n=1 Tax=Rhizobium rhizophilum TaxID=1850373 RepID=UPI00391B9B69